MKVISVLFLLVCSATAVMAQKDEAKPDTHALEADAVGVMRTINTAEVTYAGSFNRYACSLGPLTKDGPLGDARYTAGHAGLISESVRDEKRRMYRFKVHCVGKGKPGTAYKSSAEPLVKGARAFCSAGKAFGDYSPGDESGVIRYSADGKVKTCMATGKPLQ